MIEIKVNNEKAITDKLTQISQGIENKTALMKTLAGTM